jgi:hypothetical protein
MKIPSILLVLIVLFFITISTSCSENNVDSDRNFLGTWSWKSSSGGIAGTTATPSSTGKNIDLKLTSDGKYFYFTNGIISSQGTYNLGSQNCIHDHSDKKVLIFSNDESMMVEKIDNSSLLLSDEHYDGFSNSYIKK